MKKEIITIAGVLGSGKSSTAKGLAAALGYEHLSSGDIFRKMARERGESVEAINIAAEVQKEIDYEVDEWIKELGATKQKFVIDSRMAWHWIPDSFKVFLTLDRDVATLRIFHHMTEEGRISEAAESAEEVRASIDSRFASEQKRYASLYGVDPTNPLNFDITINTGPNDLETVTGMVLAAYEAWRTR